MCDKILAFYELYNERFEITKIRIILFYDVIPKSNYDRVLSNVFKHYFFFFFLEEIRNKIQFQCTFIISSYFAYTLIHENISLLLFHLSNFLSFIKVSKN